MMHFGPETLVYIIIGVIFVLAKAIRKQNDAEGKPLTANQAPELVRINPVPYFFTEPADFQRNGQVLKVPVHPGCSFKDPDEHVDAGLNMPAKLPDGDPAAKPFNLRSAVVYSVILELKYV